jgi:type IV pilus assembly protein PilB
MASPSRLVRHLFKCGVLSSERLNQAQFEARERKIPLLHHLVQQRHLSSQEVLAMAAELFQLAIFDLNQYNLDNVPKNFLSTPLIQQHFVLPLYQQQGHVVLAMADPSEHQAVEDFTFIFGAPCIITLVDAEHLQTRIQQVLKLQQASALHTSLQNVAALEPARFLARNEYQTNEAPVVAYIYQLLQDAVDQNVSDIHCEPYANHYRIRLRLDGILIDYASPPQHVAPRLAARIKVMAELNIAECRLPQDGRFEFITRQQKSIDVRISTCPVLYGEKVVLRLLNIEHQQLQLNQLGLEPLQQQQLLHILQQPQGLILVTGPTGSGKTITLYTLLHYLNNGERNICSAEDPIEIQLSGINQVAIHPALGLDFAQVLRCFLRQDPDIIMLGEIRDTETAMMACKAAQTGHLVLSTLHTQNAAGAIMRLQQLGIDMPTLANSLKLIVAQRLVRRLCNQCKKSCTCSTCYQGYQGRTGIFEILPIDNHLQQSLEQSCSYSQLIDYRDQQGWYSLSAAGQIKISQGITDNAELKRIL